MPGNGSGCILVLLIEGLYEVLEMKTYLWVLTIYGIILLLIYEMNRLEIRDNK